MEVSNSANQLSAAPEPVEEKKPLQFRLGDEVDISGHLFMVSAITRSGIQLRPVNGFLILPGKQRDKERRRHKKG